MRVKFKNFIIVSDLDGTFLNSYGKVPKQNERAVEYFKNNGGYFTLATGRTYGSLQPALPNAKELCNLPAILCNGAYLQDLDSGEKFDVSTLDQKRATRLFADVSERFPGIGVRIVANDRLYTPFLTDAIRREMEYEGRRDTAITPFDEIPHGWNKAVFVARYEELLPVRDYLSQNPDDAFFIGFSCPTLLEVQPSDGTKGSKLGALKKRVGSGAKVFAIGDHENDLILLQRADYPVTPENAIEELKRVPNGIRVRSNNDGAIAGLVEEIEKNLNLYQNEEESFENG